MNNSEKPIEDSTQITERKVRIEEMDIRGKRTFRFFIINSNGKILTAKALLSPISYQAGMEVNLSCLCELGPANKAQLIRYNNIIKMMRLVRTARIPRRP